MARDKTYIGVDIGDEVGDQTAIGVVGRKQDAAAQMLERTRLAVDALARASRVKLTVTIKPEPEPEEPRHEPVPMHADRRRFIVRKRKGNTE